MKNEHETNFDGIVIPPGCDNPLLKNSGEKIQTFTPSSYTPYVPKQHSHMMSGKVDAISIPKNPSPEIRRNMVEYLSQFQGAYLCLDLWSINQRKISRCGVLLEIGNDFLVMGDAHGKKISLIDLKPITFMNIYCK